LKQYIDKNTGEIFATIRMGDADDRKKPKGGLKRIRQFATFGGERIPMSNEDLDEIRLQANGSKTQPCLSILGFKPKDSIPWYHAMDPAYLIYPNDDAVKGSRDAFVELHAAMLRKQVLAIGEVLHRVHWSSRLVAIYPIEETKLSETESPDAGPRSPPGMMVVTLPLEDDIRSLEEDEAWQAWIQKANTSSIKQEIPDEVPSIDLDSMGDLQMPAEALVQSAIKLISRQRLVGMELGEDFENAALTEFFNYLENVALEVNVPKEEEEFDTRTDDAMIVEAVGDQIEDFREKLPEDIQISKSTGTRKRKKEPVKDDTGLDWRDLYLSGELDQVKVPQLKSYLRSVDAPLSGNKSLLVQRVSDLIKKSLAVSSSDKVDVKMEP
jgi:non-homologous end joining protein Ku